MKRKGLVISALLVVACISGCEKNDVQEESLSGTETIESESKTEESSDAEEETSIAVKPNSEGIDLYPVSDDTIEGNMLPYDMFTFCYWEKEGAEEADGIYTKHYERPLITVRNIEVFAEMDETSESITVPLGTVYTAEKSDGENWIYLQDAEAEYSGWLHIIKEDGLSYRVETGDEIYQLDNVFSYDGDGADFSDPTKVAKFDLTGMFENDLAGQSFVTLSFKEDELDEFLEAHGSDMDEGLVEALKEREQAAKEYLSEGWSYMIYLYMYDGSAGNLRYIYDDYSNILSVLKYTDLDPDIEQGNFYQVGYVTYFYESDVDIEWVVYVDYDDLGVNQTEKTNGTQDELSRLSDAELDEKIEEILNQMYPERTEVFFEAAAEREDPDNAEEYKNALAENFAENNEQTKQYIRDYVDDCIAEGETKADVVKRLLEWSETYPQLTDEQEKSFNERYWYYDDLYVQQTGALKKDTISNDVLAVSLYYDELEMGDKEICVAFAVDVDTAAKLVDTEWTPVDNGDWIFVWDDADNPMEYCYGWVTASDILELIEENQIPPTVYLCDEKQINYIDTTYLNDYSKGISFRVQEENRIGYIIQHTEEGDKLGFIGSYDV